MPEFTAADRERAESIVVGVAFTYEPQREATIDAIARTLAQTQFDAYRAGYLAADNGEDAMAGMGLD